MAEQTNAQARPQHPNAAYPSPHSHSYPSPSMQPTYTYPPSQGPPSSEQYRASPTNATGPVAGLNLPPIRAIDGQGQGQTHQQPPQPAMGSSLPPPGAPLGGAYYPPPPGQHLPPPGQPMPLPYGRMPLQTGDQRMMSGGRHKKEIKRRTKTGCLTCRKRRIKCDETHPTCRNCQKSKRECLGYDPIFKQQPGPAALQPAPPAPSATPPAAPPVSTPTVSAPPPFAHIPQGYLPAATGGFSSPAAATSSDQTPPYSAIDPALAASESSAISMSSGAYEPALVARHEPKPAGVAGSPYAQAAFQVRRHQMDELFSYGGIAPPPTPADLPVNMEEIRKLYVNDYAPGLDRLLETTWYTSQGLDRLVNNTALCQTFEFLRQKFLQAAGPNQYDVARQIPSLEAKVTWQLLSLCRNAAHSPTLNGTNGTTVNGPVGDQHQLEEARARLDVLEHLLTGEPLDANPLLQINYSHVPESDPKRYQMDFWRHLGTYVSAHSIHEPSKSAVDSALASMRSILQQLENRDVIYSIAIVRHLGAKPEVASTIHTSPWSNDPDDDHNKLFIAKRFLEDESQNGMTQVIARFAGMAVSGWTAAPR